MVWDWPASGHFIHRFSIFRHHAHFFFVLGQVEVLQAQVSAQKRKINETAIKVRASSFCKPPVPLVLSRNCVVEEAKRKV